MPAPRSLHLTIAPIISGGTATKPFQPFQPFQPSLLHQNTTPSSPLTPYVKSPAFWLCQTSAEYNNKIIHSTPTSNFNIPIRPPSPLSWTWCCHFCHTNYRLGTTRRCLLDGHYFCSQPQLPPASPSPVSPAFPEKRVLPPRLAERKEYCGSQDVKKGAEKVAARKTGRKSRRAGRKTRKLVATCTTAFDYLAWADWNTWRRELSGSSTRHFSAITPRIPSLLIANNGEAVKIQKDCFTDCDFPSECRWRCSAAYLEAVMEVLEEEEEGGLI